MIFTSTELPIEQYHASAPAWLSKTSLRDYISHGPAWWKLAYLDRTMERPSPGGALQGLALDCLLTEGMESFAARFAVKPAGHDGRTKAGREWAEANAGRLLLTAEDAEILADAAEAVRSCCAWDRIAKCAAQVSVRRESPALGLGLQSRPDWLHIDGGSAVLFDLKKTRDIDLFGKQAIELGYHLQAAIAGWCLAGDGIGLEHAYLVAVEWERGARCRVYEIPHAALEAGDRLMRETAAEIAARIKSGDWTDRQAGPEPLPIPDWLMRQMES